MTTHVGTHVTHTRLLRLRTRAFTGARTPHVTHTVGCAHTALRYAARNACPDTRCPCGLLRYCWFTWFYLLPGRAHYWHGWFAHTRTRLYTPPVHRGSPLPADTLPVCTHHVHPRLRSCLYGSPVPGLPIGCSSVYALPLPGCATQFTVSIARTHHTYIHHVLHPLVGLRTTTPILVYARGYIHTPPVYTTRTRTVTVSALDVARVWLRGTQCVTITVTRVYGLRRYIRAPHGLILRAGRVEFFTFIRVARTRAFTPLSPLQLRV